MLVVSDTEDVFLPKPTDLLVNLTEARASLESLLSRINDMFAENTVLGSAMGPALQAGFKLMVRQDASLSWHKFAHDEGIVPHWWSDHGALFHAPLRWPWCSQKPRRSQNLGNI